jgi:peptidoglycan/xylan/chitin deacetylase (PgdA/CDA1 family)
LNQKLNCSTVFLLTLDDVLVRAEWSDIPSVSRKYLPPEADLKVLDLCSDLGLKATLFIPAVVIERFPKFFRNLSMKNFEIAAHGIFHEDLRGMSISEQTRIIINSKERMEKVIPLNVSGWRSPGLYFDLGTLIAIKRSNIKWCSNIVLPPWFRQTPYIDYGNKIELPIISPLDYNLFALHFKPKKILKIWLKCLKEVQMRNLNEVFTIMIHPWIYAKKKENMAVLKEFLQQVASLETVTSLNCSQLYESIQSLKIDKSIYKNFLRFMARARAIIRENEFSWKVFTTFVTALSNRTYKR